MDSYKDLLSHNPKLESIVSEKRFDFVRGQTEKTSEKLNPIWNKQLRKNARTLYRKHGIVHDNCSGFGTDKAVIGIGAGPGFNKNKEFLLRLCHWNAKFPFKDQPFLFVVSNHQFKPCLEYGLVPHFVVCVDASDAVSDHLSDIPARGSHVPLICSMHCNTKVLKAWDKRGGLIQFYLPMDDDKCNIFEKETGHKVKHRKIHQGGNVLNVVWVLSRSVFGSSVFMAVGNDLSYDIAGNEDERRKNYYADGDYSANLKTGRDEAKKQFKWMGFELNRSIITDKPVIDLKPKATIHSLFGYKTWIETMVGIQDGFNKPFHYYNCSESGILGVMCTSEKDLNNQNNWVLLDEIIPERWHTRLLSDAVSQFLSAREGAKKWRISTGAESAVSWRQRTGGVSAVGLQAL